MDQFVIANPHYLRLDLYLENGANDGQCVANNDEDIPAIQKLKLVQPWDFFTATVPAVECVLLFRTQGCIALQRPMLAIHTCK